MAILFSNLLERLASVSWRSVFEHTKSLHRFLIRIGFVTAGRYSREMVIVGVVLARRIFPMIRRSGLLFTALYLKQASTSLMQYYAEVPKAALNKQSGPWVGLSRCGIPVIIPIHHRHLIMRRDERADSLVRLYLSWFSVCRVIKLAKKVSKSTFQTITEPTPDMDRVKEVLSEIRESWSRLQPLYLPFISKMPLDKGLSWVPTWKSTPNDDRQFEGAKAIPNCFTSVKYEVSAFARQLAVIHTMEGVFSPCILYRKSTFWPLRYRDNTRIANEDLDWYERYVGPIFHDLQRAFDTVPLRSGRLAQSLEGAGKRRLFVIGNYIKQRLLRPVHDWGMDVLRRIPMDGTFDQHRPLLRLIRCSVAPQAQRPYWSFDLSAATDRWPVSTIATLVGCIFGPTAASCIVNGCLALNSMWVGPPMVRRPSTIVFVAGQPLGYYGSWALFALTHHYMVWLAADRVDPGRKRPFSSYALLGDDIVISDRGVAAEYRKLLSNLQVSISETKSLVSETGCLEFAKQFWVKGKNLSPVSAKAVLAANSPIQYQQLASKYNLSPSVVLRFSGAGYRVMAKCNTPSHLTKRWKRTWALSQKLLTGSSGLPLEWWIGRGKPLSPYLKGIIVRRVLDEMKLSQLNLPPKKAWWSEGEQVNSEYTTTRNWMAMWLKYLKWYSLVQSDPDPSLHDLFNPPVVANTYKRNQADVTRVLRSWSLLYQLYDMADQKDLGWMVPSLGSGISIPVDLQQ